MIAISDYLKPKFITFLDCDTRDEAIGTLVDLLDKAGILHDKKAFYEAIIEREKIVSTGIGMGAAIPHAKLSEYHNFFIAVGISRKGLEWDSPDGSPVRLVFLIGGPDDKQTEYLQILSSLTQVIKDDKIRRKLLTLNSPTDMIEIFSTGFG